MSALFVVDKYTEFVGNTIRFDASGSTGPINIYEWDMDDGAVPIFTTSAVSADYSYQNYGLRVPALTVWETSASDTYILSGGITVNPHPHISMSGIPAVNSSIAFTDTSGQYYINNSVTQITFNYGDGSPQVVGLPTDTFIHQFSATGNYLITLTAIDINDNTSVDTRTISILAGNTSKTRPDYITLCGTANRRFDTCKSINLTNFLSEYLQETEVFDLVKFFEDFLNTMYSGLCGFQTTETKLNTSATQLTFNTPAQNSSADPRISILEKVKRLTELHDPDLIDIEYIQFFAKYLGYNVEISRGEIGGFGTFETSATVCSASENEKYLRFMVANLPNWYKIKTTRDMIKVMLYSFGLIGDIIQYYTKPIAQGGYDRNFEYWKPDYNDDLATIPDDWFPTPHFSVKVDLDRSLEENPDVYNIMNILMTTGDKIIRAIESVRPINDVFHNLTLITTEYIDIWIGAQTRFSRYIRIDSDGYADWWNATSTPISISYVVYSFDFDYVNEGAGFTEIMNTYINSLLPGTDVRFSPIVTYANSGIPTESYNSQVRDIIVDGSNMFAAVNYTSTGGIYKSTNDGATWTLSSTGMTSLRPTCFAKNGTTLFVGTEDAGVFISSNGGATWTTYNAGLTTLNIRDLYFDVDSELLYAATNSGVFVDDGGWTDATSWGGLTDTNVQCVFAQDGHIFAGTATGGIFVSFNSPWMALNTGLTSLDIRAITNWYGDYIVGTYGGGVFSIDIYNHSSWYPSPVVSSSANSNILSLYVDQDLNLVIGTDIGVFIHAYGEADYFIGSHKPTFAFVEKGTSLYAGYTDGEIAIIDKGKTIEGLLKRQNNLFAVDGVRTWVTPYKNNVASTEPIPISGTEHPVFNESMTVFHLLTS